MEADGQRQLPIGGYTSRMTGVKRLATRSTCLWRPRVCLVATCAPHTVLCLTCSRRQSELATLTINWWRKEGGAGSPPASRCTLRDFGQLPWPTMTSRDGRGACPPHADSEPLTSALLLCGFLIFAPFLVAVHTPRTLTALLDCDGGLSIQSAGRPHSHGALLQRAQGPVEAFCSRSLWGMTATESR